MKREGYMQDELNMGQDVTIVLKPAEALVLFDLLSRWEETDATCIPLEHRAEHRALWQLLGRLESTRAEPFMPDYNDWLDRARELLRDEEE